MRKENGVQNIIIVVLAITVLVMTVGYAAFTQNLTINNSTATFNKAKWDVHFDADSYSETSAIQSTSHQVSDTSVMFNVTLPKPGDTYSFTINAKNYGTIAAKMVNLSMTSLSEAQSKYITYTVNYDGTSYSASTSGLNIPLAADASHTVTVTVAYVLPTNPADLPAEDVNVSLTAAFDYQDAA